MRKIIILSIITIFMSCSGTKKTVLPVATGSEAKTNSVLVAGFDIQGHRGCRGLMPENTIPAMLKALDLGVTTLEMDVVITKDKKVILSHDQWFNHEITTKADGTYIGEREERKFNINWMTYDETKTFDVGLKQHPRFPNQQKMKATKPLLADVIDSVNEDMVTRRRPFPFYNIETKTNPDFDGVFHPKPDEFVELLVTVIKEKNIQDYVIIQSFDFRTLRYLHEHYPAIKTAALVEFDDKKTMEEQLALLGFVPTIYSPAHQLVTDELIKKCHERNIRIIPWTVNTKDEIEKYRKMGVDGIITDFPNLLRE